jgi:sugar-specific transcriptional regulator TrmB
MENQDPIGNLVKLGFSEYEAKAYVALLRDNPITGYQLAKLSSVPRSMIYEVLGKLVARGAAMTLRKQGSILYAPASAVEFLDQLRREHEDLVTSLKNDLTSLRSLSDSDYVWNIAGHENIMAKADEMIGRARERICLSLLPETFRPFDAMLSQAIGRGVHVVVYSTQKLELPGGRVVVAPSPGQAQDQVEGLWLILAIDGQEVLIGEMLTENRARASWTKSPLFVFVTEHHMRTDPYLPKILALLGEKALEIIREEDRELFARALESRLRD